MQQQHRCKGQGPSACAICSNIRQKFGTRSNIPSGHKYLPQRPNHRCFKKSANSNTLPTALFVRGSQGTLPTSAYTHPRRCHCEAGKYYPHSTEAQKDEEPHLVPLKTLAELPLTSVVQGQGLSDLSRVTQQD